MWSDAVSAAIRMASCSLRSFSLFSSVICFYLVLMEISTSNLDSFASSSLDSVCPSEHLGSQWAGIRGMKTSQSIMRWMFDVLTFSYLLLWRLTVNDWFLHSKIFEWRAEPISSTSCFFLSSTNEILVLGFLYRNQYDYVIKPVLASTLCPLRLQFFMLCDLATLWSDSG